MAGGPWLEVKGNGGAPFHHKGAYTEGTWYRKAGEGRVLATNPQDKGNPLRIASVGSGPALIFPGTFCFSATYKSQGKHLPHPLLTEPTGRSGSGKWGPVWFS